MQTEAGRNVELQQRGPNLDKPWYCYFDEDWCVTSQGQGLTDDVTQAIRQCEDIKIPWDAVWMSPSPTNLVLLCGDPTKGLLHFMDDHYATGNERSLGKCLDLVFKYGQPHHSANEAHQVYSWANPINNAKLFIVFDWYNLVSNAQNRFESVKSEIVTIYTLGLGVMSGQWAGCGAGF
jgi:hypothetical protein